MHGGNRTISVACPVSDGMVGVCDDSDGLPDWWRENRCLREEMGLPPYRPPRFEDDTYTHEVVPELEDQYDCRILFVGVDTHYPDDWSVEVDGEILMDVPRRRDENGNTVYELSAAQFVEQFETEWREQFG